MSRHNWCLLNRSFRRNYPARYNIWIGDIDIFSGSCSQHNDRAINLWRESQRQSLFDWKVLSLLIFSCCYGTYFRFYKTSTKFVSLIVRNEPDVIEYIKYLLGRIVVVPVNACKNFPILQKNFYMLLKIIWHTGWRNVFANKLYKDVHHRTKIYTDLIKTNLWVHSLSCFWIWNKTNRFFMKLLKNINANTIFLYSRSHSECWKMLSVFH